MAILVTGGAGYIGSHTCVELLNAGYDVVIADNLYNASEKAVDRVKQITGKDLKFYKADIRDKEAMNEIFEKEEIESVIHFAGLKAVGESVVKPLEYYENNIAGTLVLCDVMRNHGVKNIIFTDIDKDGMLAGPNFDQLAALRASVSCEIIASGGVSTLEDIAALKKLGIDGAIAGKAVYTGTLDLAKAIKEAE